ncbi:MAG: hypothetical protein IMZ50_11210, partial [Candidatus Atribacteria bacterium]|nr:hypothetical protein [Candidatus Atribacteria bacterium]
MKFDELHSPVGDEPVFSFSLLGVVGVSPQQARLQLVRWVNAGKLIQLRRGLYGLKLPFMKVEPHPEGFLREPTIGPFPRQHDPGILPRRDKRDFHVVEPWIFDIAHLGIVGDLFKVIPKLLKRIEAREQTSSG